MDTYTVTYTDGTTFTYNVTNGTDGIGVDQVNADWNATSGVAEILNKPAIPDISGLQHQLDSLQNVLPPSPTPLSCAAVPRPRMWKATNTAP